MGKQRFMKQVLVLLGSALAVFPVWADIYKYVDEQGVPTYTNVPSKLPASGATRIAVDPSPSGSRRNGASQNGAQSKSNAATPANFPRVDNETQRKRDASRRQILEDELKAEEKLLSEARKNLTDGEAVRLGGERNYQKYLDRVQKLRDDVAVHEKNIAALKKELVGVK
jgi:hypothetical protein